MAYVILQTTKIFLGKFNSASRQIELRVRKTDIDVKDISKTSFLYLYGVAFEVSIKKNPVPKTNIKKEGHVTEILRINNKIIHVSIIIKYACIY